MSAPPAKSRFPFRTIVVVILLVAAGIAAMYATREAAVVATVQRGAAVDTVAGSLIVHAQKDVQEIKSELGGRIAWIDPRQIGEPFKAGEPILELDSTDLKREIQQAKEDFDAALERIKLQKKVDARQKLAEEALENAKRQNARGEISADALRMAQRAFDKVVNDLALEDFDAQQATRNFEKQQEARRRMLEKMKIVAPMDCVLQAVMFAPGALIGPGTTVATYLSNERVVIAKIGEEDIGRVKVGQTATVRLLNVGDDPFEAKVTTILPFADADTQRYSVYLEVRTAPDKLKPFSTGEVGIVVGQRENQLLVPRRAIFNDNWVYVVKNGVTEKRQVTVGFKSLNLTEIIDKLKDGEQVIVEDVDRFHDGQHVRTVVGE